LLDPGRQCKGLPNLSHRRIYALFGIQKYVFTPKTPNNRFSANQLVFVLYEKDQQFHRDLFRAGVLDRRAEAHSALGRAPIHPISESSRLAQFRGVLSKSGLMSEQFLWI
jgi:hypothetical protein